MSVTDVRKDPEKLTMEVTCEFPASVEQVWQLWADPRKLERHGNIHRYQCTGPCSKMTWYYDHPGRAPDLPPDLKIDLATFRALGTLPRCPECGALVVAM